MSGGTKHTSAIAPAEKTLSSFDLGRLPAKTRTAFHALRDGSFLDAGPVRLGFQSSTFAPVLGVVGDGADWLVAVASTDAALYRVLSSGTVSRVVSIGGAGSSIALTRSPQGFLMWYRASPGPGELVLDSGAGAVLSGPHSLSGHPPPGIVIPALACDQSRCLLSEVSPLGTDGFLVNAEGRQLGPWIHVDGPPQFGEVSALSAGGEGHWLVAYATSTIVNGDPHFEPIFARHVQTPQ